jgi:predicted nuclease of restriction endonuclease-like (RecB) superfamily
MTTRRVIAKKQVRSSGGQIPSRKPPGPKNTRAVRKGSGAVYEDIRSLLLSARQTVARGVDLLQVRTNYEIGRRIVEQEQQGENRAEYGKELLVELAERLTEEFGTGFSISNLRYMRQFYLCYPSRIVASIHQTVSGELKGKAPRRKLSASRSMAQTVSGKSVASSKAKIVSGKSPIHQTVSGELAIGAKGQTASDQLAAIFNPPSQPFSLSWSHYVFLIGLNEAERDFYEIEAAQQGWTVRELKRQFDAGLYERLALSRNKDAIRRLAREGQLVARPEDLLKEPYVLEFLGFADKAQYSESDLESAIVDHIERFLLELGKGFLFEARQKRFTFDEEHFFVDLVLYNRLLRCYVLIDLKLGKLTHQDLGQMQMYVHYFDRFVKTEDENHTIGIVLCKKKNTALVEITLPKDANIHAREYQLYLPSKEELQRKLEEWIVERGNPAGRAQA